MVYPPAHPISGARWLDVMLVIVPIVVTLAVGLWACYSQHRARSK